VGLGRPRAAEQERAGAREGGGREGNGAGAREGGGAGADGRGPSRTEAGSRRRASGAGGGGFAIGTAVAVGVLYKKCLYSSLYTEGKLLLPLKNANRLLKSV